MSINSISLYKQIDKTYIEDAQIEVLMPKLSYQNAEGSITHLDLSEVENFEIIEINRYDDEWSSSKNELRYSQVVKIGNPTALFGPDKITDAQNGIGLATHIFSRTGNFQKTLASAQTLRLTDEEMTIEFNTIFPEATLRGVINIELFFYLKEFKQENPFQATVVGTRLSQEDLFDTKLIVDGEGAMFPITEESNPGGPLWTIRKYWMDPSIDSFDSSSVQVVLNNSHKLFNSLTEGKTNMAQNFMDDIVIQAMAMIIDQTVRDMKDLDDSFNCEEAQEGSVLAAVNYWITTYNVKVENIMTITNSLRTNLTDNFKEEEE